MKITDVAITLFAWDDLPPRHERKKTDVLR